MPDAKITVAGPTVRRDAAWADLDALRARIAELERSYRMHEVRQAGQLFPPPSVGDAPPRLSPEGQAFETKLESVLTQMGMSVEDVPARRKAAAVLRSNLDSRALPSDAEIDLIVTSPPSAVAQLAEDRATEFRFAEVRDAMAERYGLDLATPKGWRRPRCARSRTIGF